MCQVLIKLQNCDESVKGDFEGRKCEGIVKVELLVWNRSLVGVAFFVGDL